ncbi:MAG: hypothetical protein ACREEM_06795 [Blastocatellia bacterium]
MLRRVAALLMVLLFAGQAVAGGIACSIDAINNGFDNTSETSCSMQEAGDCDEMACCALGKSPTGSMAAMVCCEFKCGESTGGAQFNFTPQTLILAPSVVAIRLVPLAPLSEVDASAGDILFKSAENNLLHHDPPDLFLSNSTFLI